jgi:hypothetical protein
MAVLEISVALMLVRVPARLDSLGALNEAKMPVCTSVRMAVYAAPVTMGRRGG